MILGSGDPSASHVKFTELPSFTIISGDVLESIIFGGTLFVLRNGYCNVIVKHFYNVG